jgi:hypothetical protein
MGIKGKLWLVALGVALAFNAVADEKSDLTGALDRTLKLANRFSMMQDKFSKQGNDIPPHLIKIWQKGLAKETNKLDKQISAYMAKADSKDPATKKFEAEISQKLKKIQDISKKLGAIDLVKTPPDIYNGKDKAELLKIIKKDWKAKYPKDDIIGVRFSDPSWKHRDEKRYHAINKSHYRVNVSSMEVKVIVKKDAKTAYIYPVFLQKDHLNKDQLEVDVDTAKSSPLASGVEMLMKNYKP